MATAVAKGIILSISIITALGLAVYENPQVQEWLEEQRRKLAELLRQIGQDLDPQSRQAAEAFAFEGRTPANNESLRREATGSQDAAALATGRRLSNATTVRRIPIGGPADPQEAEERRRKGREYLARRNQQMYELQQKRKAAAKEAGEATPPTPTFDELVDLEGKLKAPVIEEKQLPSLPAADLPPEPVRNEMREIERNLSQPMWAAHSGSAGPSDWQSGSSFANPFGDEYALERSETPKPPVPPKIELDRARTPPITIPGSFSPVTTEEPSGPEQPNYEGLSYEEQLAVALSLSEQESSSNSATVRQSQPEEDDDDLRAAIAASIREMDDQQAAFAIANAEQTAPQRLPAEPQLLVDLTPSTPSASVPVRSPWEELFDPPIPLGTTNAASSEASDELYRLTPELTRARLATFDAQQPAVVAPPSSAGSSLPFDPVREAVHTETPSAPADVMDLSFFSAPDQAPSPASTHTPDRDTLQLIDVNEDRPDGTRTPTSRAHSSFGFQTDSDSDTFASVSAPVSRPQSPPHSEMSEVEVVDLIEDSDVDMLSEEGDGVATPDSWSEVGSRDADSEAEEPQHQPSRVTL
ncbi:hypothetical protein DOTSEDRAFT_69649 [Lecanosticta acicola]|uniref:Uncharacterized protein n=1 Tax=Lecanosticta acicola TaxID=111012 RepID=A0AAI8Z285_9PEZI|nr:hypothetical protein DOTSEDRAFT_69649 [Lecanosticta acicola]